MDGRWIDDSWFDGPSDTESSVTDFWQVCGHCSAPNVKETNVCAVCNCGLGLDDRSVSSWSSKRSTVRNLVPTDSQAWEIDHRDLEERFGIGLEILEEVVQRGLVRHGLAKWHEIIRLEAVVDVSREEERKENIVDLVYQVESLHGLGNLLIKNHDACMRTALMRWKRDCQVIKDRQKMSILTSLLCVLIKMNALEKRFAFSKWESLTRLDRLKKNALVLWTTQRGRDRKRTWFRRWVEWANCRKRQRRCLEKMARMSHSIACTASFKVWAAYIRRGRRFEQQQMKSSKLLGMIRIHKTRRGFDALRRHQNRFNLWKIAIGHLVQKRSQSFLRSAFRKWNHWALVESFGSKAGSHRMKFEQLLSEKDCALRHYKYSYLAKLCNSFERTVSHNDLRRGYNTWKQYARKRGLIANFLSSRYMLDRKVILERAFQVLKQRSHQSTVFNKLIACNKLTLHLAQMEFRWKRRAMDRWGGMVRLHDLRTACLKKMLQGTWLAKKQHAFSVLRRHAHDLRLVALGKLWAQMNMTCTKQKHHAFQMLCQRTQSKQREAQILHKISRIVERNEKRHVLKQMQRWGHNQSQKQERFRRVFKAWIKRETASSFRTWRVAVHHRKLLHQTMWRFESLRKRNCFHEWKMMVMRNRLRKAQILGFMGKRFDLMLRRGFNKWKSIRFESRATVKIYFDAWKRHFHVFKSIRIRFSHISTTFSKNACFVAFGKWKAACAAIAMEQCEFYFRSRMLQTVICTWKRKSVRTAWSFLVKHSQNQQAFERKSRQADKLRLSKIWDQFCVNVRFVRLIRQSAALHLQKRSFCGWRDNVRFIQARNVSDRKFRKVMSQLLHSHFHHWKTSWRRRRSQQRWVRFLIDRNAHMALRDAFREWKFRSESFKLWRENQAIIVSHNSELASTQKSSEIAVENLVATHAAEIELVNKSHDKEKKQLIEHHEREIAELMDKHEQEMSHILAKSKLEAEKHDLQARELHEKIGLLDERHDAAWRTLEEKHEKELQTLKERCAFEREKNENEVRSIRETMRCYVRKRETTLRLHVMKLFSQISADAQTKSEYMEKSFEATMDEMNHRFKEKVLASKYWSIWRGTVDTKKAIRYNVQSFLSMRKQSRAFSWWKLKVETCHRDRKAKLFHNWAKRCEIANQEKKFGALLRWKLYIQLEQRLGVELKLLDLHQRRRRISVVFHALRSYATQRAKLKRQRHQRIDMLKRLTRRKSYGLKRKAFDIWYHALYEFYRKSCSIGFEQIVNMRANTILRDELDYHRTIKLACKHLSKQRLRVTLARWYRAVTHVKSEQLMVSYKEAIAKTEGECREKLHAGLQKHQQELSETREKHERELEDARKKHEDNVKFVQKVLAKRELEFALGRLNMFGRHQRKRFLQVGLMKLEVNRKAERALEETKSISLSHVIKIWKRRILHKGFFTWRTFLNRMDLAQFRTTTLLKRVFQHWVEALGAFRMEKLVDVSFASSLQRRMWNRWRKRWTLMKSVKMLAEKRHHKIFQAWKNVAFANRYSRRMASCFILQSFGMKTERKRQSIAFNRWRYFLVQLRNQSIKTKRIGLAWRWLGRYVQNADHRTLRLALVKWRQVVHFNRYVTEPRLRTILVQWFHQVPLRRGFQKWNQLIIKERKLWKLVNNWVHRNLFLGFRMIEKAAHHSIILRSNLALANQVVRRWRQARLRDGFGRWKTIAGAISNTLRRILGRMHDQILFEAFYIWKDNRINRTKDKLRLVVHQWSHRMLRQAWVQWGLFLDKRTNLERLGNKVLKKWRLYLLRVSFKALTIHADLQDEKQGVVRRVISRWKSRMIRSHFQKWKTLILVDLVVLRLHMNIFCRVLKKWYLSHLRCGFSRLKALGEREEKRKCFARVLCRRLENRLLLRGFTTWKTWCYQVEDMDASLSILENILHHWRHRRLIRAFLCWKTFVLHGKVVVGRVLKIWLHRTKQRGFVMLKDHAQKYSGSRRMRKIFRRWISKAEHSCFMKWKEFCLRRNFHDTRARFLFRVLQRWKNARLENAFQRLYGWYDGIGKRTRLKRVVMRMKSSLLFTAFSHWRRGVTVDLKRKWLLTNLLTHWRKICTSNLYKGFHALLYNCKAQGKQDRYLDRLLRKQSTQVKRSYFMAWKLHTMELKGKLALITLIKKRFLQQKMVHAFSAWKRRTHLQKLGHALFRGILRHSRMEVQLDFAFKKLVRVTMRRSVVKSRLLALVSIWSSVHLRVMRRAFGLITCQNQRNRIIAKLKRTRKRRTLDFVFREWVKFHLERRANRQVLHLKRFVFKDRLFMKTNLAMQTKSACFERWKSAWHRNRVTQHQTEVAVKLEQRHRILLATKTIQCWKVFTIEQEMERAYLHVTFSNWVAHVHKSRYLKMLSKSLMRLDDVSTKLTLCQALTHWRVLNAHRKIHNSLSVRTSAIKDIRTIREEARRHRLDLEVVRRSSKYSHW